MPSIRLRNPFRGHALEDAVSALHIATGRAAASELSDAVALAPQTLSTSVGAPMLTWFCCACECALRPLRLGRNAGLTVREGAACAVCAHGECGLCARMALSRVTRVLADGNVDDVFAFDEAPAVGDAMEAPIEEAVFAAEETEAEEEMMEVETPTRSEDERRVVVGRPLGPSPVGRHGEMQAMDVDRSLPGFGLGGDPDRMDARMYHTPNAAQPDLQLGLDAPEPLAGYTEPHAVEAEPATEPGDAEWAPKSKKKKKGGAGPRSKKAAPTKTAPKKPAPNKSAPKKSTPAAKAKNGHGPPAKRRKKN